MKRAFTIVELLVVIGILAILTGVVLSTFSGSTEAARATKCVSNLRSLANAASAYAMEGSKEHHYPSSGGYYPLAGSVETKYGTATGGLYGEFVGWISWLSVDYPYGKDDGDKAATSHKDIEIPRFYGTGDYDKDRFMLTHGSIWKSTGKSPDIYVCPTHRKMCEEKKIGEPIYSYQMNAYFGYDKTQGQSDMGLAYEVESSIGKKSGGLARADRILLFAEIQAPFGKKQPKELPTAVDRGSNKYLADAVLNYKATVDGKKYGDAWKGTPETIGFNHPGKHGKYYAHVVFADGHTEKLTSGDKGLKYEELTAILCEGGDFAFTGDGYQYIEDDKVY